MDDALLGVIETDYITDGLVTIGTDFFGVLFDLIAV